MRGAEAVSEYVSLPLQEAFDIEYWLLEEAKLQRMPKEQPLSRKVALITGSAGGIGKAIADKLAKEGACVVLTDLDGDRLEEAVKDFGKDTAIQTKLNVLDNDTITSAFKAANLAFGGVDIIVNCAGLAISKPLTETTNTAPSALACQPTT